MIPKANRNSDRGFTLVELLVVIAIIAILAALAFPAFNSVMSHARTAKCSSNLRNIGAAMITFAGDNNGNLPISGATIYHSGSAYGSPTIDPSTNQSGWTEQLEPYIGASSGTASNPIFQCPDSSKSIPGNANYSYFNGAHAAYSQNVHSHAASNFGAVNLMKVQNASQLIMGGDIAFDVFGGGNASLWDADKDDYTQDCAFSGYTAAQAATPGSVSPITIHGGSVNILFYDGHVENMRSFDPTKVTTVYQGPGASYNYLY